jgi:hypothetical protein
MAKILKISKGSGASGTIPYAKMAAIRFNTASGGNVFCG